MAHRVVWSARAVADVEAIASFIAKDSPTYARSVVRRIVALTRTLGNFPLAGRKVPEFDDEAVRELIAYSYRIIYRVQAEEVIVASIVHGKRDIQ
jgi:plasmid stabilization system protein ParE